MNLYRGEVRRTGEMHQSKSFLDIEKNNFEQVQHDKYSRNKDF